MGQLVEGLGHDVVVVVVLVLGRGQFVGVGVVVQVASLVNGHGLGQVGVVVVHYRQLGRQLELVG